MFGLLLGIILLGIILYVAHLLMVRFGVEQVFRILILLLITVVVVGIWWTRYGGSALFYG